MLPGLQSRNTLAQRWDPDRLSQTQSTVRKVHGESLLLILCVTQVVSGSNKNQISRGRVKQPGRKTRNKRLERRQRQSAKGQQVTQEHEWSRADYKTRLHG